MNNSHNPKLHLGTTLQEAKKSTFRSGIANGPPLLAVTYELVGKQAPRLLPLPEGEPPKASAVVIAWADAEWAALQHVFCAGSSTLSYGDRTRGMWTGWGKYSS
jgi:hypothetical protein